MKPSHLLGAGMVAWGAYFAPPASVQAQTLAEGKAVYDANCVACHGDKLQGQPDWRTRRPDGLMPPPPLNETGHAWRHPEQMLVDIIKRGGSLMNAGGPSGMPPFQGVLSDDQVRSVVAYLRSHWPSAKAQEPMPTNHKMPSGQPMPGMTHSGH